MKTVSGQMKAKKGDSPGHCLGAEGRAFFDFWKHGPKFLCRVSITHEVTSRSCRFVSFVSLPDTRVKGSPNWEIDTKRRVRDRSTPNPATCDQGAVNGPVQDSPKESTWPNPASTWIVCCWFVWITGRRFSVVSSLSTRESAIGIHSTKLGSTGTQSGCFKHMVPLAHKIRSWWLRNVFTCL